MAGPDSVPALPGCTDVVLVRAGIPSVYRCIRQGTAVSALVYSVRVDASTAATFSKQAKALQGVNHPHVAPVLESGVVGGFPYLISVADTGTLAEQVRSQLRSPAELAVLGRQLAEGLATLHGAGLIHGGLTPGSVVLQPDGRPLLSALTLGLGQHTGHAALNSPSQLYVAPETFRRLVQNAQDVLPGRFTHPRGQRRLPADRCVQHGTQRIQVGRRSERPVPQRLRGDVQLAR